MTDTPNSAKPLANRVILITGAGGGIGAVVARAVAAAGAECILLGRSLAKLEPVYDAIVADGNRDPALFPLDLTKAGDTDYQRLANGIHTDCGRLDGIVHLATHFDALMPLASVPVDDWKRTMHVNVTSAFGLTQLCLPLLREATDASVLFAADTPAANKAFWGAYAASKAALLSLTRLFALEYGQHPNMHFNAIEPGPRATGLRKKAFPNDDPAAQPPKELAQLFVDCLHPGDSGVSGHLFEADGSNREIRIA